MTAIAPEDTRSRARLIPNSELRTGITGWEECDALGTLGLDGCAALARGFILADGYVDQKVLVEAVTGGFFRVVSLILRTLVLELNIAREAGLLAPASPTEGYRKYITLLSYPPYREYLFEKYPVLMGLLEEQYRNLRDSFFRVCEASLEWREIEHLGESSVTSVHFIGDPHHRGRQGAIVQFQDGTRCVVKSRATTASELFMHIARIVEPQLKASVCVPVATQVGEWSVEEYIDETENGSGTSDDAYRYGAWAALLHYTNTVDMHFENFVLSSEGPVPVDLECALMPAADRVEDNALFREIGRLRANRAMLSRMSLIPNPGQGERGGHWSPLVDRAIGITFSHHIVDEDGTDRLRLRYISTDESERQVRSGFLSREGYVEALEQGFADAQEGLALNADEVTALIRHAARTAVVRVVHKPTQLYADILRRVCHPRFLLDHDAFDEIVSGLIRDSGDDPTTGLGLEELTALRRGYVPFFECEATGYTMQGRFVGQQVDLSRSGVECAVDRMTEVLDERLRGVRVRELRQLLVGLRSEADPDFIATALELHEPEDVLPPIDLSGSVLSREIVDARWRDPRTGDIAWASLQDTGEGTFTLSNAGYDLYHGLPGILCALLSQPNLSGNERDTAVAIAESCLQHSADWMGATQRHSVYSGAAGSVYALWNAVPHGLVAQSDLRDITHDMMESCVTGILDTTTWDVFAGSAGLLILVRRLVDANILQKEDGLRLAQKLCGHLASLAARDAEHPGLWWVLGDTDERLGGFVHGVAGVAMATYGWQLDIPVASWLYRGAVRAQTAIRVGTCMWADRRAELENGVFDAWCHGAAGIIIADAGTRELARSKDVEQWKRNQFRSPDLSLCHGLAGAVVASATIPGGDRRAEVLRRALARDHLQAARTGAHPTELSESLFTGRAGIAYALGVADVGFETVGNVLTLGLPARLVV